MDSSRSENQKGLDAPNGGTIYIVGPRRLQNEAIASCLKRETSNECAVLEDINHLLQEDLIDNARPRLVLLDCQGKDPEKILPEVKPYLQGKQSDNHLVVFNLCRDSGIESKCVLEGIRGFFYEEDPLDRFMKGVEAVFEGEIWLSRKIMTKCLLEGAYRDEASKSANGMLTSRQIEILALVAVGATNDEIGDKLCISAHTVKTHLYNIFRKIDVPNRMQAALWAAKHL
jgi:LuxR family transcriptional regulator of csgAB operon